MAVQNSKLKKQSSGPKLKYTILIQPYIYNNIKNTGYTSIQVIL